MIADNSGTLAYVSIRHTGFETAPDETPCGLYLAGVGSGSTIDMVELYANVDDGFLVNGGTVSVKNVVTSHFGDDRYDCDKGYAGVMDNLIGIMGSENNSLWNSMVARTWIIRAIRSRMRPSKGARTER